MRDDESLEGATYMLQWNNWLWVVIVSFFVLCFSLVLLLSVKAHDHGRPDLVPWYKSLASKKGPCCDGSEAQALDDPHWKIKNGHYEVFLESEWVVVPETALVDVPNRDGRTLVWPFHLEGHPAVRCFMPGSLA